MYAALSNSATAPEDDLPQPSGFTKHGPRRKGRHTTTGGHAGTTLVQPHTPTRSVAPLSATPRPVGIRLRPDPHPQKSKEDKKKYFMGDTPLPVHGGTRAHPVYFDKNRYAVGSSGDGRDAFAAYFNSVREWVTFWVTEKKQLLNTEDIMLNYVAYLSSSKDPELCQVDRRIMEKMKQWLPKREYKLVRCACVASFDAVPEECYVWLPTEARPLNSLLEHLKQGWNRAPIKADGKRLPKMGSASRLTVYVDEEDGEHEDSSSPSPIADCEPALVRDEDEKEATPKEHSGEPQNSCKGERDAFIVNVDMENLSYGDILRRMQIPESQALIVLKRQFAIERHVRFGDVLFVSAIKELAKKAASEDWGKDHWILRNVVDQTVVHQLNDMKFQQLPRDDEDAPYYLNINLIDQMSDPLFMRLGKYKDAILPPHFFFQGFVTAKEVPLRPEELETVLPRPTWFKELSDLMLDPKLPVEVNTDHILTTNRQRIRGLLPNKNISEKSLETWLSHELHRQLNAAKYNHRLCTPQYYQGRIQLLLPLYDTDKLVLAATVSRELNKQQKPYYVISTVLEPAWAYNNARLLSSIESNWLLSSLAKEEADATEYDEGAEESLDGEK